MCKWHWLGGGNKGGEKTRRTEHLQAQPCLELNTDQEGGKGRVTARRRERPRRRG